MKVIDEINKWVEKNKDEILLAISELVQIKTENLPPSGNEKEGQEYIFNKISKFIPEKDIDVFDVTEVKGIENNPLFSPEVDGARREYKGRPNIVARLEGHGVEHRRSIVLSGHMDVVPVREKEWFVFKDPYSGKVKDGRMYGRGTIDMKAGTFCGFMALKCIKDLNIRLSGDIYAESVVDEECGGVNGTIACRMKYPDIDFAILAEPSNLNIGIESRGGSIWKITLQEEGPGGYSQVINPIYKLNKIINVLKKYDQLNNKNLIYPENYTGDKDLELLLLEICSGGKNYLENVSTIPRTGHIYLYLPVLESMEENDVRNKFVNFIKDELIKENEFKKNIPEIETVTRWLRGHKTDINHPAMLSIKNSFGALGLKYREKALSFTCDSYAFKEVSGTEVVVIGPRGGNLHGVDEFVEVESVFNLLKIMIITSIDYCL